MKLKFKAIIIFFFFVAFADNCIAQTDTISKQDSIRIYNDLKKYSGKRKVTKFLYGKFVKNRQTPAPAAVVRTTKKQTKGYEEYNCKIIRSIQIEIFDPFGYDLKDTTKGPRSVLQKYGNAIHLKSKNLAIRNFFLFKKGKEFDAYELAETERLIRDADIFRDVIIYPTSKKTADSVDLIVRVLDKWSLTGRISANTSRVKFNITEHNFLGLGHEFSNTFEYSKQVHLNAYSGIYNINRIGDTYINTSISNVDNSDGTSQKGVDVERPFFSPITKWAGGLAVGQTVINDSYYLDALDSIAGNIGIKYNEIDGFIARSINLEKCGINCNQQANYRNLILSVRSLSNIPLNYGSLGDSLGLYKRRDFIMGMVAFSLIDYERQNYLFKFGETEDVPVGSFYALIGGIDHRNNSRYAGFRIGSGGLTNVGYLSVLFEGGKYYNYGYRNPAILNTELTYYSPILSLGNWKFRQFVKPRLTLGWEGQLNKSLMLSDDGGIQGFNSSEVFGLNRATLYLQTQAYAPYNFLGFRFGPVFYFNCGMISNDRSQLFNSNFYSSVGVGILFKNELLVLNPFQVSIAFYPYIPGSNKSFQINSFRSVDFQLPQLNIDKPDFVQYK